jgi:dTDP-4-dehydrorhamnose 3,5-epimerase
LNVKNLPLPGCLIIEPVTHFDARGSFTKTFNRDLLVTTPLQSFSMEEEFFTTSQKNVIRGMHFQIPPFDHNKIVFCLAGRITDVLLDLRGGSDSFGKCCSVELSDEKAQLIYIPSGVAHGFVSRVDSSVVGYKVDHKYSKDHDSGVAWNSFGFNWGVSDPILSVRDASFRSLANFKSPF